MKFLILLTLLAVGCSKTNNPTKSVEITDDVIQFEPLTINTSTAGVIPSASLDFASLAFQQSATQSLIISNKSSSSLVIAAEDITSSMLPPFTITKNTCIGTIASRKSCVIDFKLSNSASLSSEQIVSSSLIVKEATISLTGTLQAVPAPSTVPDVALSVSPTSLQFGTLIDGQTSELSVIVKNNATVSKTTALAIISSQKVAISSNTCPASLGSRKTCTIKFKYTATGNETVSEQSLTSISNNPFLYSVIVDNPTVSTPVTVTTVEPLTLPATISTTQPGIVSGSVIFKNNGISTFEGPVTGVSSDPSITISSISCLAGLVRGRSCTVNYSVNSLLAPLGETTQSIFINAKTTALSSAFVLNFNISASGPSVACSSLSDSQLQSYGYTTTHIASVSGNTPNCVIETCDPYYERAGGTEAKTCNPKLCSGLDSVELISLDYIDDASGSIGYNPQEYLSGTYPVCSLSCPSGYETNPSNSKRCQPVADVITYQASYSAYGLCSVTQACQGVGEQSRSYTCQKYINGNLDSTVANSFCESGVTALTALCQSPMGQISVSVDNGSKQVSCLEGSQIQNYVASSLACNLGYVPNESLQLCEQEIAPPSAVSLIGQLQGDISGKSFFKIDENFNISELTTNINQRTVSSGLSSFNFNGTDLIYNMITSAHGSEIYRLALGSTTPQIINFNPAVLSPYSVYSGGLTVHNGFAYFNARFPVDSLQKCVAVDLSNYSNTNAFTSSCNQLTIVNGSLYGYMLFNASTGSELVRLNGTTLELVSDIYPGATNSNISSMIAVGNDLYFAAKNPTVANTPASGLEIFKYNTVTSSLTTYETVVGSAGSIIVAGLQVYSGYIFYREGNAIKRYNTANSQISTISLGNHTQNLSTNNFLGFGDSVYFSSNATGGLGTEMIRHVLSTGISSVVDLVSGSSSSFPSQIKTDGTSVFIKTSQGITKYNVSNNQFQVLDLSSPSFGTLNSVGNFEINNGFLYYTASQTTTLGFGNEFFKYSISTGEISFINVCPDTQITCSGISVFGSSIVIKDNYVYLVGGNQLTGSTEIVKVNKLDNSFEIIDSNKLKMGLRNVEQHPSLHHIISNGKIFFSGENNDGFNRLFVKDINSSSDAVEINLPTPYLDHYPINFYQSSDYIYFGAKVAQTESRVFQYNKSNGNVVAIDFPQGQTAQSPDLTTFDNGKYYMVVNWKQLYMFDEATNLVTPLVLSMPYDPQQDPTFDLASWEAINCTGMNELEGCDPPGMQLLDPYDVRNPVVFNGVLYFYGPIYSDDSGSGNPSVAGYGVYMFNPQNLGNEYTVVTLLTPKYESSTPGQRFNPLEPMKTANHVLWQSNGFPQDAFHVYKDIAGNSVEESIQFMEDPSSSVMYEASFYEDNQKDLYFTDVTNYTQFYRLQYGGSNSIFTFAAQNSSGMQQLIQNQEVSPSLEVKSFIDLDTEVMFQYGNQLVKCLKTQDSCSIVPTPQTPTNYFSSELYRLGNSILFSKAEGEAVIQYGRFSRKLYRLNLDDNSISEIPYNGEGLTINNDLIQYAE